MLLKNCIFFEPQNSNFLNSVENFFKSPPKFLFEKLSTNPNNQQRCLFVTNQDCKASGKQEFTKGSQAVQHSESRTTVSIF